MIDTGSISTLIDRKLIFRSASALSASSIILRNSRRLRHLMSNCTRYSPFNLASGAGAGPKIRAERSALALNQQRRQGDERRIGVILAMTNLLCVKACVVLGARVPEGVVIRMIRLN